MYYPNYMWTSNINTLNAPIVPDFMYGRQNSYYAPYSQGIYCNMAPHPPPPMPMGAHFSHGYGYNPVYAAMEHNMHMNNVRSLRGHDTDVFMCAWSPCIDLLASGSNNNTARIWDLTHHNSARMPSSLVLTHYSQYNGLAHHSERDITALDWSSDGLYLATGSFEGYGQIWGSDGTLYSTLVKHFGPIFAMKWNYRGNLLLSAGGDKKAILWDTTNGMHVQTFQFHTEPVIDVDWKTNTCFASCSVDGCIYVCELDCPHPIRSFLGHQDEVNAVRWNPQGNLLASCSDDASMKIWTMEQATPVHDFRVHNKEIYTIKWSSTGPCTNFPNAPTILASGSFDSTVRLWDIEKGISTLTLQKHSEPIYCIDFSPNGQYLVSGSLDNWICLWSTRTGELIHSFKAPDSIYEVSWNSTGNKIGATSSNASVIIIDLKWY